MRQLSRGQLGLASPWPRFSLTLLLLLPLLASAYRVRGANTVADDGSHEVPGHSHHGPSHSHGSVLQKVQLPRLLAVSRLSNDGTYPLRAQPLHWKYKPA